MKRHVVVVDDAEAMRALVVATLDADERFVVVAEAADGREALAIINAVGPDLVVLDLVMPGVDGLATLNEITARHPEIAVVVFSERADQEAAALAAGARAFVPKSAPAAELVAALAEAAGDGRPPLPRFGTTEDFQRVVLDALSEGFVVQDASGAIVYANPAAERILSLRAQDMLGLTSKDPRWGAVGPDGEPFPAAEHPIVEAQRTGESVGPVVMGVRRPSGERRWLEIRASPILDDPDAAPVASAAVFTDITERREGEAALGASEERFRTAVETMLDGFMLWSAVREDGGRIIDFVCEFANPAVADAGYTPEELVGRRLLDLTPRLGDTYFERYVDVVETGDALRLEVPWFEGTRVRGAFDVAAVRMGDGVALTYRDVTDRARTEQTLRETEEQTRRFLEAMPVGVGVVERGGVVFLNAVGERIAGRGAYHEARGAEYVDYYQLQRAGTGAPYPFDELPVVRALFQGEACSASDVLVVRDGIEIPLESFAAPVRDAAGDVRYALTVFTDVTERVAKDAELARAHAELAGVNEELAEFAAVAAHDLAAPLRAISGFAALLEERSAEGLDDEGRGYLVYVQSETDRMRNFIDDLLAYSRAGASTELDTPVDLTVVVAQARELLRAELETGGATLEVGPLPTVTGDAARLLQVLSNLLANAIRFRRPDRALRIEIAAERRGDEWIVTVADNGVGVAEAERERIFAPFHRGGTADAAPGHGLGLSICRRIVERHGGGIWVDPAPDHGSRFCFSLPGRRAAATSGAGSSR